MRRTPVTISFSCGEPLDRVPPPPPPDPRDAVQIDADAAAIVAIPALADEVAARRPEASVALVALLGRRIQADYLAAIPTRPGDAPRVSGVEPSTLWFDTRLPLARDGRRLADLLLPVAGAHTIDLTTDLVPLWPWARGRRAGYWPGAHRPSHRFPGAPRSVESLGIGNRTSDPVRTNTLPGRIRPRRDRQAPPRIRREGNRCHHLAPTAPA